MASKYQRTNSKKARSAARNKSSGRPSAGYKSKGSSTASNLTSKDIKAKSFMYHQAAAILIFSFAIILFCLIIIKGEHVWTMAHNVIFGLFGNSCFILPVLLMYVSLAVSMEKQSVGLKTKILPL